MKKILMRAVMSPFDESSIFDILTTDRIGSNLGNLLFPYSMMRNLMSEEVSVDTTITGKDFWADEVDRINSEYDCLVLPFANALRPNYEGELRKLTRLIKKLKIPCVIAGIGCNISFKQGLECQFPYDDTVKKFLKAALDKSAVIGTRGEATAAYLTRLGFREESHHRVIGCPSMYLWGSTLPEITKKELRPDSPVSFNWKINIQEELHRYIRNSLESLTNYHYVPQITDEIMLMYYGVPLPGKSKYPKITQGYPRTSDHPFYRSGQARSFVNVPDWLDYFKTKELSFGSRIHGNIAPLLAGVPSYIAVPDYRVWELTRYHHIPCTEVRDLKPEDDIFRLYEKADYSPMMKNHGENFGRFADFLEENGLTPALDREEGIQETVFDQKLAQVKRQHPLEPFFSVSVEEQARRLTEIQGYYCGQYQEIKEQYDRANKIYKMTASVGYKMKTSLLDFKRKKKVQEIKKKNSVKNREEGK